MPTDPQVDAWLAALDHPQKDVIAAVRATLLGVGPTIHEGIKWNVGSFRATDWFATFNVRGPKGPKPVALVLHRGAKARAEGTTVPDPARLLSPLGPDRAMVTFADLADVAQKAPALKSLVRAWIAVP